MKAYITIGRHKFTPKQVFFLQKLGLEKEVARQETYNPELLKQQIGQLKPTAIIVQGLPINLLADLLKIANNYNIPVYMFKTEPTENEEEADIKIPSREGKIRLLKTTGIQRVKRILIEFEDVI